MSLSQDAEAWRSLQGRLTGPNRLLAMPVAALRKAYAESYERDAAELSGFVLRLAARLDIDIDEMLGRYTDFVHGQQAENIKFQSTGCYRFERYDDVAPIIESEEFQRENLFTLLFSYLFAPFRYQLYRYIRHVLARTASAECRCLEIATGAGLDAAAAASYGARVETFDLNRYSPICLRLLQNGERIHFSDELYDFSDIAAYDLVMMIELLEHVEQPQRQLSGIRRILRPTGTALVTFALRMPQIDHISLFRSAAEARRLCEDEGLRVVEERLFRSTFMDVMTDCSVPADELAGTPDDLRPAVYAVLLQPCDGATRSRGEP